MVTTSITLLTKKGQLEEQLAFLTKQSTLVNNQIKTELSDSNRSRLKEGLKNIWKEMEKVEAELKNVEAELNLAVPKKSFEQKNRQIKDNLPKIDFDKARRLINKEFAKKEIESLFFLENSYTMAGELCIDIIKNSLFNPRHFPIGINFLSPQDHFGILQPLAKQLKVDIVVQIAKQLEFDTVSQKTIIIQNSTNEIINKLCKSIQTGSVIFIEINNWNHLINQDEIARWFLKDFWQPLINQCKSQEKDKPGIKIICVIDSEYPIASECKQIFKNYPKSIELPLKNWNQEDIQNWLITYSSGLLNFQFNLTGGQINEIAKQIYLKTDKGTPRMVRQQLEELPKMLLYGNK